MDGLRGKPSPVFGITKNWSIATPDPGVSYIIVCEGDDGVMVAWVREEENASENRQRKRGAEEADKVEAAPGVTVASLRRLKTALIGPTQELPKRDRLCR